MQSQGSGGTTSGAGRGAADNGRGDTNGNKRRGASEGKAAALEEMLATQALEDPLVAFLQKWWRVILVALLVAGAIVYGKNVIERTRTAALERSSDIFYNMRNEYETYKSLVANLPARPAEVADSQHLGSEKLDSEESATNSPAEQAEYQAAEGEVAASLSRLQSMFQALSQEREPYRQLGALYQGLVALERGDIQQARGMLMPEPLSKVSTRDEQRRFLAELKLLALARGLYVLDAYKQEAETLLLQLLNDGVFLHSGAAYSLASSLERDRLTSEMDRYFAKHPEQEEVFSDLLGDI
jgi:hypothetical protein